MVLTDLFLVIHGKYVPVCMHTRTREEETVAVAKTSRQDVTRTEWSCLWTSYISKLHCVGEHCITEAGRNPVRKASSQLPLAIPKAPTAPLPPSRLCCLHPSVSRWGIENQLTIGWNGNRGSLWQRTQCRLDCLWSLGPGPFCASVQYRLGIGLCLLAS